MIKYFFKNSRLEYLLSRCIKAGIRKFLSLSVIVISGLSLQPREQKRKGSRREREQTWHALAADLEEEPEEEEEVGATDVTARGCPLSVRKTTGALLMM